MAAADYAFPRPAFAKALGSELVPFGVSALVCAMCEEERVVSCEICNPFTGQLAMAMVASPSFLKDMQVNWGSIASVSLLELHHGLGHGEEASRAMETVQAKAKQPEDELREIVAELIAAYSDPDLQRRSREELSFKPVLQVSHRRITWLSFENFCGLARPRLHKVLVAVVVDIAEAYGLPGTTEGLQRIQNSVQRRITEGDIEVRCLADEALMLIGMSPLQNIIQEVKAEDSSGTEIEEFFLNLRCETPLATWSEEDSVFTVQPPLCNRGTGSRFDGGSAPQGGLLRTWAAYEKLGLAPQHIISTEPPPVARLKNPTAAQDFDYMRARCGHRYVKVKGDSCWDNKGRQLFLNDPTIEISVSDYLDLVEVAEEHETCISWYMGKLPLHTDLPELFEDINNSPNSPWRKFGTCFGENNKGVHTYFGCGGNTTCIHSDPSENLLMVVMGEKFMDIYPPCDAACALLELSIRSAEVDKNWGNYKYVARQHEAQPQKVHLKAGDLPLAMHPAMPIPLTGLFHVNSFTFQSSGGTPFKACSFGLGFADEHGMHLPGGLVLQRLFGCVRLNVFGGSVRPPLASKEIALGMSVMDSGIGRSLFWICAYEWLPMEIVPMTHEVKGAKSTRVIGTGELSAATAEEVFNFVSRIGRNSRTLRSGSGTGSCPEGQCLRQTRARSTILWHAGGF
ncbi:Lysine-specific demethylase 8 [Symbiodinium microadriaticum]|uniref:Lysine-specific demethylase 8 n=1 Tax=Symbiodinium microadriaticum TaxID=2951 RepID=A0A1Q9CV56_SYMMI|nr:Lysine-specific demethylase 8 [Symbiodinium microadriaticum]